MRRTSIAAAALAIAVAIACGKDRTGLIYNDSLLCGSATQACAPDAGRFDLHVVDRSTYQVGAPAIPSFDMQLKPGTDLAGFAWVERSPRQDSGVLAQYPDSGVVDYDIVYAEFDLDGGFVAQPPQRVQTVQRFFGLSLAYQGTGEPAVAYLGGPLAPAGVDAGFDEAFWFQNDAAISYRVGGQWTERLAAKDSAPPLSNPTSAPSDQGTVVGLYPALLFQGPIAVLAYRDVHFGQSAGTGDFNSSDLEMAVGGPTNFNPVALLQAGDNKRAYGGHSRIVPGMKTLTNGQRGAAVVSDRQPSAADTFGEDLQFSEQQPDGTWRTCGASTPTLSPLASLFPGVTGVDVSPNTQAGPSIDYRQGYGYALAFTNRSANGAFFLSCADGKECSDQGSWDTPDPVFQQGTGGWYVSTAISPDGDPSIAYYVCSQTAGRNETSCTGDDYLAVTNRGVNARWADHTIVVDTGPAFQTRMAFWGKRRVIGYRNGASGTMQIAIEKP